ncbi:MAG: glycosyltransferase [Candidatus Buchananbacteria bacterium]|nr:glycosyltransferase [Candidatus Buchananbacteria bacterium]
MISVITPCKNVISEGREAFFRKMMETLRAQTYQDFEHILVDSDSKDGTASLLSAYVKSGHITTLISEPDNNLHEALNKGLKIAQGEYIYVMNTDNYFATDTFFERSLDALKKYAVDYTHGDRIIVKRDGSPFTVKKGDLRVAFYRMPFRYQTMIIKKEVYDELGAFDESFKIASDYKFMLKLILAGKRGYYFPESLIYSLDGGITKDRQVCINEVTQVLFECYGETYGLTVSDCRNIYTRKISPELFSKICAQVKNQEILESIQYGYEYEKAV